MTIVIQPLTPQLLPHWLDFFDNTAFTDNPGWADCYCCCYQLSCSNKEWGRRTKGENRLASQELIRSGEMKGYLAFEDQLAVGWCSVNDFNTYPRITASEEIASLPREGNMASIICFIIGSAHRGKGIARQLLRQAVSDSSNQGFDAMEAYPRVGSQLSPTDQFHGPLQLYLDEGFSEVKKFEKYAVVRKLLKQKP